MKRVGRCRRCGACCANCGLMYRDNWGLATCPLHGKDKPDECRDWPYSLSIYKGCGFRWILANSAGRSRMGGSL